MLRRRSAVQRPDGSGDAAGSPGSSSSVADGSAQRFITCRQCGTRNEIAVGRSRQPLRMGKWRALLFVAIMAIISVAKKHLPNLALFTSSNSHTARRGIVARRRGWCLKHPTVIVPGFVTTGLEAWEALPCAHAPFRQRIWGTFRMLWAIASWDHALRRGLAAVDHLIAGYHVWAPVLEAFGDVGYDQDTLVAVPYDWRPAVANMEYRDRYFTTLKNQIEHLHKMKGEKVLIVAHSWGETVTRNFLFWVDRQEVGWTEKNVAILLNIAGCPLGVPKAVTALLSGEMRDTAELPKLPLYLTLSYLPQPTRAAMLRSWGSLIGMLPKGGNHVWGNATWAPDDTAALRQAGASYGAFITGIDINSRSSSGRDVVAMYKRGAATEHSLNVAMALLLQEAARTSPDLVTQIGMWGASIGINGENIGTGYDQQADVKFHDPMVDPMPDAPSLKMFNVYGVGKPTERGYIYSHLTDEAEVMATKRGKVSREVGVPLSWSIATKISDAATFLRAGVRKGDGDGTVPLVSLGLLSHKGWRTQALNPANFSVTTHELQDVAGPFYSLRGGPKSGEHVDILGNLELHDMLLALASGHYEEVPEKVISNIGEIADRIPF